MRVAVIGLGMIGKLHARILMEKKMNICALCDLDTEKAQVKSKLWGLDVPVYSAWETMLEKEKPDVVHICTPHYLHAEMIVGCLQRDIHVLCEKPMCIRKEEISLIRNAEKGSNAIFGVCHQNRYNDVNVFLKQYLCGKEILSAHGTVVWKRDKAYYGQDEWRGKWLTEGGGVLINQALHTLDLMQWLCGTPQTVKAQIDNFTLEDAIEVEDTAMLLCEGERRFTFYATNAGGCDMATEIRLKLKSGENIVAFPDSLWINGEIVSKEDMAVVLGKCCYGNGHEKLIADFYDCIETGRDFSINAEEAANVVRIILGAYESQGQAITVEEV